MSHAAARDASYVQRHRAIRVVSSAAVSVLVGIVAVSVLPIEVRSELPTGFFTIGGVERLDRRQTTSVVDRSERSGDFVEGVFQGVVWIGVKERALRLFDQQPGERQSLGTKPAVGFQQGYECQQPTATAEDRRRV